MLEVFSSSGLEESGEVVHALVQSQKVQEHVFHHEHMISGTFKVQKCVGQSHVSPPAEFPSMVAPDSVSSGVLI